MTPLVLATKTAMTAFTAALPSAFAVSHEWSDDVSLASLVLGRSVPQGSLFAYLFRRFGYPNCAWDDYKNLACYRLSTTHPGMIMCIIPYAGGNTNISFSFLASREAVQAVRTWDDAPARAWDEGLLRFIEDTQTLPAWMPDFVEEVRSGAFPRMRGNPGDPLPWQDAFPSLVFYATKTVNRQDTTRGDWYTAMMDAYKAQAPFPGPRLRAHDPRDWDVQDPFKPYALAMLDTLRDLMLPVWVRDVPITPHGPVSDAAAEAYEDIFYGFCPASATSLDSLEALCEHRANLRTGRVAPSAGHAAGSLINHAPDTFADLTRLVLELGQGDAKAGMKAAMRHLQGPIETLRLGKDKGRNA